MTCRGCAKSPVTAAKSLWGEQPALGDILASRVGISVCCDDGLPDILCESCINDLLVVDRFVRLCQEADQLLRRRIASPSPPPPSPDPLSPEKPPSSPESPPTTVLLLNCPLCEFRAPSALQIKKHAQIQHQIAPNDVKFPCQFCSRQFNRKTALVIHLRTHSGEKPFGCEFCDKKFSQSGSLKVHRRSHTGETPYSCEICSKSFSSSSMFVRHKRGHQDPLYSCDTCGARFRYRTSLMTHAAKHSDVRSHVCDVCGKAFKVKSQLRTHIELKHVEKRFVCDQCGKAFSQKTGLDGHVKKLHSEDSEWCRYCRRVTSNRTRHALLHSADFGFKCDLCDRSFRHKHNLIFHMYFHTNVGKFECRVEGCDKSFPKSFMLEFHERKYHSNEATHVCRFCGRGYFRSQDLVRHANKAHPGKEED